MMKALLAGVAMLALGAGALPAQPPAPPPPMDRDTKLLPLKRVDVPALVAKQFAALDANHDGGVTEAEIRDARRARWEAMRKAHRDREFARLDANRDGSVSRQEFDAPPPPPPSGAPAGADKPGDMPPPPPGGPMRDGPPRGPEHRPMGPMGMAGMMPFGHGLFEQADTNKDGKVTLAEAQAFALKLFDRADANHDGIVDREEMRAMMMRDGPGGHGPRGPHGPPPPGGPGGDMPPPPPPPGT